MKRGAFACIALAAFAACGGGKPAATGAQQSTDSGAGASFKDLGVKGLSAKARITYSITDANGTQKTVVVAQDPPRRSFKTTDENGAATLLISNDAGEYTACSADSCYTLPGLGSAAGPASAAFLGPLAQGYDVFKNLQGVPGFKDEGTRTIAGRAATCASWTPAFAQAGYLQCLDKDTGLGLYFEYGAGKDATKVEAKELSSPADSDFTPTHPVQSIPTSYPSYPG